MALQNTHPRMSIKRQKSSGRLCRKYTLNLRLFDLNTHCKLAYYATFVSRDYYAGLVMRAKETLAREFSNSSRETGLPCCQWAKGKKPLFSLRPAEPEPFAGETEKASEIIKA